MAETRPAMRRNGETRYRLPLWRQKSFDHERRRERREAVAAAERREVGPVMGVGPFGN